MITILIVEDERHLASLMSTLLRQNGYHTFIAFDGMQALALLEHEHIDLIITDLMMPHLDGFGFVEALRNASFTQPIMVVSAKERIDDKRMVFEKGADDYMVKPIDLNELLLRVKALLRRANITTQRRLQVKDFLMDYDNLTIHYANQRYAIPKKEFYLLYKLLSYPNHIFTRQQLMDEIWGMDSEADERTVDVHIKRLRERFSMVNEFQIVTIRGLGYKAVFA
ncbi:MAG: response regulator transcription factor [Erysipelotrichaceae bacterium]